MNAQTFALVAGVVFLSIALIHAVRIVMGWEATIGGWEAPRALYVAELVVLVALGWLGIRAYMIG